MIPPFALTFVEGLLGPYAKFAKPLIYLLSFLLAFGAVVAVIKIHDHRVIAASQEKTLSRVMPANDRAATERARETIANDKHEQELHNVIAAQPDQPIAPTSRALSCERLRHAGRNPPACR